MEFPLNYNIGIIGCRAAKKFIKIHEDVVVI